jgi:hypothetical protein
LIARENQNIGDVDVSEMPDALPNGVGGSLKPVRILGCLLGGKDVDKAFTEIVEAIGSGNVAVE